MASTTVTEYVEKYTLDPSGYVKGAQVIQRTTTKLADDQVKAASSFDQIKSGASMAFGFVGTAAAAATGGVLALAGAGAKVFSDYAGFESLVKALEAIEGSSREASKAMADLQKIAQQPGLGFEESVRGYSGLRRAGLDQGFSKRAVSEAGNANALSGGDKESFGRILLALQQIAVKPFLQGDELLQLMEAGIAAPKMLKDRFGTADGEELKKRGITSEMALRGLVEEMAKLPRVAGGAQNTLDNIGDSLHFASVNAGKGLLDASGALAGLSTVLDRFTNAGIWAAATAGFADAVGLTSLNAEGAQGPLLTAVASFMTLGDVLGNVSNNLKDIQGHLDGFSHGIENLSDVFSKLLGPISDIPYIDVLIPTLKPFKDAQRRDQQAKNGGEVDLSPAAQMQRHLDELTRLAELEKQKREKAAASKGNRDPMGDPADSPNNPLSGLNTDLPKIVLNTERTASASEKLSNQLNNLALGGGINGQAGLSLNDLSDIRGGRGGGANGLLNQAVDLIAQAMEMKARQTMRQGSSRFATTG